MCNVRYPMLADTDEEYIPNARRSESLGSTGGRRANTDSYYDQDEPEAHVVASTSR